MREYINANETIREDDYSTIMAAIAEAKKDGCNKVLIPRYNARTKETKWSLSHAIELPTDLTVILDNCYMEQARGSYENLFINEHCYDLDYITKEENVVKNIAIIGIGHVVLSGGEHNHKLEQTSGRPYHFPGRGMWVQPLMQFINVDGLQVENIHIEHQRWWSIVHEFVKNATYKNIDFFAYPHVPNLDGIDMRVGCNHFYFENITGRTGDDVLACTALSGGGELSRWVGNLPGHISDIKVRNLKAASHNCFLMRLLNHDGNEEFNYELDTFMDTSDKNSFNPGVGIGIGSPFYFAKHVATPGDTRNIVIKNLYSRGSACIRFDHCVKDVTVSNVHAFDTCRQFFDSLGDGLQVENAKFDHMFYSPTQPKYFDGTPVEPKDFTGVVVQLPKVSGDIQMNHLEIDDVKRGIYVNGDAKVKITNYQTGTIYEPFRISEDAEVIVNGEKK